MGEVAGVAAEVVSGGILSVDGLAFGTGGIVVFLKKQRERLTNEG